MKKKSWGQGTKEINSTSNFPVLKKKKVNLALTKEKKTQSEFGRNFVLANLLLYKYRKNITYFALYKMRFFNKLIIKIKPL